MVSYPLSRKILAIILAASTLITTVLTGVNLYIDYKSQMGLLYRSFAQLEHLTLKPLTAAVWSFDDEQISKFMTGIVATGDFVEARLTDRDDTVLYHIRRPAHVTPHDDWWSQFVQDPSIHQRFTLILRQPAQSPRELGYLEVWASRLDILNRLTQKLLLTFAMQAVKTLIISLVILAIVQKLLTSHLLQVARYLESFRQRGLRAPSPLRLRRQTRHPDELDSLVQTLNAMIQELTQYQKSSEDRLQEKERELEIQRMNALHAARLASLGELAGGIAHEINNPLAIIMGSAQRLTREIDKSNIVQAKRCTDQILQTGDRIAKVVYSLRKLARDGDNSPRTLFSMTKLLTEVLSLVEEKIRQEEIRLDIDFHGDPQIYANEVEVSQVLFNLISNAVEAIKDLPEKWVLIQGLQDQDHVIISVVDSGQGIPTGLAERIMEPFFTTKEVGKGTGLGLSISLSIAKRHGGDLRLDRSSPFTKFDFYLPKDHFNPDSSMP
jgi:C4-dicarboxylate-specific signal transduction histidine kinase